MNKGLIYLLKMRVLNYFKKMIKSPVKLLLNIVIITVIILSTLSYGKTFENLNFKNEIGYVTIISIIVFMLYPYSIKKTIERKSLLFAKEDLNYIMTAPISPKEVLLYAGIKPIGILLIVGVASAMFGILSFGIAVHKVLLYILTSFVVSNLFTYSFTIIMYSANFITKKIRNNIMTVFYIVMAVTTIVICYYFYSNGGISLELLKNVITSKYFLLIPILGWNISLVELIILGPNIYNIIGASLYIIMSVTMAYIAYKLNTSGEYYEDALDFSVSTYKKIDKQKSTGSIIETNTKKLKKVKSSILGKYAKAIFGRQILEYKKKRMFIFTFRTLLMPIVSIGAGILFKSENIGYKAFIIIGVYIYLTIFFKGNEMWYSEFKNYYIYIIPDTNFKKIFYVTLVDNIKGICEVLLYVIPVSIMLKFKFSDVILIIIECFSFNVINIYINMINKKIMNYILMKEFLEAIVKLIANLIIAAIIVIPVIIIQKVFNNIFITEMVLLFLTTGIMVLVCLITSLFYKNMEQIE